MEKKIEFSKGTVAVTVPTDADYYIGGRELGIIGFFDEGGEFLNAFVEKCDSGDCRPVAISEEEFGKWFADSRLARVHKLPDEYCF